MSDPSTTPPGYWLASDGRWYPTPAPPAAIPIGGARMECEGITGTVDFDGTFVTIKRTGAMARMTVGQGREAHAERTALIVARRDRSSRFRSTRPWTRDEARVVLQQSRFK